MGHTNRRLATMLLSMAICALLGACDVKGFNLGASLDDAGMNGGGDGGNTGDGDGGHTGDGDGGMNDGDGGTVCVPSVEVCDGADNDCDGDVDNGFNLDSDPANCGVCGNACSKYGTVGTCSSGECSYTCRTGFVDLDLDIESNGCEYQCTPTTGDGTDPCDLSDNDCDGDIDEDVDITTDVNNCGGCGNVCTVLNANAKCEPVESDPVGNPGVFDDGQCTSDGCLPGYLDKLPSVPGCEYACPVYPGVTELCNGIDDDCDGSADDNLGNFDREGNPDSGADNSCHPYLSDADGTNDAKAGVGACGFGTWTCAGTLLCQGYGLAAASDFCDGSNVDDDCDGVSDEDTDTDTDPSNCGSCGNVCDLDNATALCASGGCKIATCDEGSVDLDLMDSTGCEYQCTKTGPEICDGLDNDCDGDIDDADDSLVVLGNFCKQIGPCATDAGGGAIAPVCGIPGQGALSGLPTSCGTTPAWYCPYDTSSVTVDATTCAVVSQEGDDECDSADNDCDGVSDETFTNLNTGCDDGGIGACRGTGTVVCAGDGIGTECDITSPGLTVPAAFEECNTIDDDCDGTTDEDAVDDMVAVTFTPASSCTAGNPCTNATGTMDGTCQVDGSCVYWVDAYEASRPDSDDTAGGSDESLACSLPNKVPWRLVTEAEAEQACLDAGKRLCTSDEWHLACAGDAGNLYPYGDSYDGFTCNGADWNDGCLPPGQDTVEQVFPTGYGYSPGGTPATCDVAPTSSCVSDFGVVDMSGNLREWTSTLVSGSYQVRGGSYTEPKQGISCDTDFIKLDPANAFDNLGFRCCRSDMPPQAP